MNIADGVVTITAVSTTTASITDVAGGGAVTMPVQLVTIQGATGEDTAAAQSGAAGMALLDTNATTVVLRVLGNTLAPFLGVGKKLRIRVEPISI